MGTFITNGTLIKSFFFHNVFTSRYFEWSNNHSYKPQIIHRLYNSEELSELGFCVIVVLVKGVNQGQTGTLVHPQSIFRIQITDIPSQLSKKWLSGWPSNWPVTDTVTPLTLYISGLQEGIYYEREPLVLTALQNIHSSYKWHPNICDESGWWRTNHWRWS